MKREAIATMLIEHQLSERHACALVGPSRDSYRNPALASELNTTLSHQITEWREQIMPMVASWRT